MPLYSQEELVHRIGELGREKQEMFERAVAAEAKLAAAYYLRVRPVSPKETMFHVYWTTAQVDACIEALSEAMSAAKSDPDDWGFPAKVYENARLAVMESLLPDPPATTDEGR